MTTFNAENSTLLLSSLAQAQPNDMIVLTGSDYPISNPIAVPKGVTITSGNAVTMNYVDGLPDQLLPGAYDVPPDQLIRPWLRLPFITIMGKILFFFRKRKPARVIHPVPVIHAVDCPPGDLVRLRDGSQIRRLIVKDTANREGNPVVIQAVDPNQRITAQVIECEIVNPGTKVAGGTPPGPLSRAIIITSEPLATAARIDVTVTGTRVHSSAGGSSLFAINFASNAAMTVRIDRCRLQGNLDVAGGITKTGEGVPGTHDSSLEVTSAKSLFEPGTGTLAWQLFGGGQGPQAHAEAKVAERNSLTMISVDDRIAGSWQRGIVAAAGRKFNPTAEPANDCTLSLTATRLTIALTANADARADLSLSGCRGGTSLPSGQAPMPPFVVGDNNIATITLAGFTGSGTTKNQYFDEMFWNGTELSGAEAGNGNRLNFTGDS